MKKSETYGTVLAEIARLQQRAADLRRSELPGVIGRIREAIEAYGLTAADLGFGGGVKAATKAAAPAKKAGPKPGAAATGKLAVGVAKYRDPKSGKTWTGRGKPPLWIAGVKDRTPFLIDGPSAAAQPAEAGSKTRGPKAGRGGRKAAAAGRQRGGRKNATPAEGKPESGATIAA